MRNTFLQTIFMGLPMLAGGQLLLAQTTNVGIGTTIPKARLHVSGGNVIFSSAGDVPASTNEALPGGPGRRLLWYADKAAFRAGYVPATQWDKDSIGIYSTGMGYNAKATGTGGVALGAAATAKGDFSIAIGYNVLAEEGSVAIGHQPVSFGQYATSIGAYNKAFGNYSLAMGNSSTANGLNAVAIGLSNTAAGDNSLAMGNTSIANGFNSVAIGFGAKANGDRSIALGVESVAQNFFSMAAGFKATSAGAHSKSMGYFTESPSGFETVFGVYNTKYIPTRDDGLTPTDRMFTIGNGVSEQERSNALTILKNGNMGLGISVPNAPLQFSNTAVNRKIVLYEQANNDHQYYGFGINGYVLRYQINDVGSHHIFYAGNGANSSVELMRIQGNGRVGIGTNAPDQLLTVNGNASKPGGGSWATFSDGRLKKNVADYTAGLNEILAIHPVSFQYNELSGYTDTDSRYVGIIAQEMENILPATIRKVDGDDKVKEKRQFDGSELTYTLVNAIKQEHAQVETLRKENEALKARLAAVEKVLGIK